MATFDEHAQQSWLLHSANYAEPVTTGVEIIDPRHDRGAARTAATRIAVGIDLRTLALATDPEPAAEAEGGSEPV